MLRAEFKLREFKIAPNFTKTLDKRLGVILRTAARAWLRAVLTSVPARGGFPVLTGEAKGTLIPLGRFLRVAVPVRPQAGKHDRSSVGVSKSDFNIRDDASNPLSFVYRFDWSSDVLHYYINEFYGRIPYAPWMSLEQGGEAFIQEMNEQLVHHLPHLFEEMVE